MGKQNAVGHLLNKRNEVMMKRNIYSAFIIHFIISLLFLLPNQMFFPPGLFLLPAVACYIFAGRKFLKPLENKKDNFISIWLLAATLFCLVAVFVVIFKFTGVTISEFEADDSLPGFDLASILLYTNAAIIPGLVAPLESYAYLFIKNYNFMTYYDTISKYGYLLLFITPFVPSTGLWIGMILRKRKDAKTRAKMTGVNIV